MPSDDLPTLCGHRGWPTRHSDDGVVPVFGPADCGNGLGLAATEVAEDECERFQTLLQLRPAV